MGIDVKKRKAIFLDRDGVINPPCGRDALGHPESPLSLAEFRIFPFIAEAVKMANRMNFLVIVATNQPAIAKGKMSIFDLELMHDYLLSRIKQKGGKISKIYTCLHHSDRDQVVVRRLLKNCQCRKPNSGMLQKAKRDFGLCLAESWMIGDSWKDVVAGKEVGCKTVLVSPTKENLAQCDPDYTAKNLIEAMKIIRKEET